jgi:hypothetical protein
MLFDSKMNRHWKAALTSIAVMAIGLLAWLPNPSRAQSAAPPFAGGVAVTSMVMGVIGSPIRSELQSSVVLVVTTSSAGGTAAAPRRCRSAR